MLFKLVSRAADATGLGAQCLLLKFKNSYESSRIVENILITYMWGGLEILNFKKVPMLWNAVSGHFGQQKFILEFCSSHVYFVSDSPDVMD